MPATKAAYAASLLVRASGGFHIMQVTRYRVGAVMGPHESYEVGVGSDFFHVIVERNREFVDDCLEFPAQYKFGIVAFPNS